MFSPKSILVPTDFSQHSDKAVETAIDLAGKLKAKVFLLHVIDEGLQQCVEMYCLSDGVMKQMEREGRSTSQLLLEQELAKFPDTAGVDISFDIRKGYPSEEIVNDQKERAVDLIVIASHGRTGILKTIMGSTADKVLKNASCPVLLVRP